MAANLTAQYHKAEEAYRRATSPEEELAGLQGMLREIPKHKSSEKMQADLKQKISKVKKEVEAGRKKGGRSGARLRIPRQGAGTVVLLGGPNAGKSQLLKCLTRATPDVAPYPFTTQAPTPGMMPWQDVLVQLIDTPPITQDFFEPYMQGLIRGADLALLVLDLGSDDGIEQAQEVLDKLNSTKTRLASTSYLDERDVGLSYTKTLLVPNKIDAADAESRYALFQELCPLDLPVFKISALNSTDVEALREAIYGSLDVIRVYTKMPAAKEPDMKRPFTLSHGDTVLELAAQVHKDFVEKFKHARVWGSQVHDATAVKSDHVLHDRDVVELHMS